MDGQSVRLNVAITVRRRRPTLKTTRDGSRLMYVGLFYVVFRSFVHRSTIQDDDTVRLKGKPHGRVLALRNHKPKERNNHVFQW